MRGNQLDDRPSVVDHREPAAVRHPFGNEAILFGAGAFRAVDAKVQVLAVDRHDCLSLGLVVTIGMNPRARHGVTLQNERIR